MILRSLQTLQAVWSSQTAKLCLGTGSRENDFKSGKERKREKEAGEGGTKCLGHLTSFWEIILLRSMFPWRFEIRNIIWRACVLSSLTSTRTTGGTDNNNTGTHPNSDETTTAMFRKAPPVKRPRYERRKENNQVRRLDQKKHQMWLGEKNCPTPVEEWHW